MLVAVLVMHPDKYILLILFGDVSGRFQIVQRCVFAVIDDVPPDSVQEAVIKCKALGCEGVLQTCQGVVFQVVVYFYCVGLATGGDGQIRQAT